MRAYISFFLGLLLSFQAFSETTHPSYQLIKQEGHEIHLLTFDPKTVEIVQVKSSGNNRETVSHMVKTHEAYAGINGGFFAIDDKQVTTPVGSLKIKGEWIQRAFDKRAVIGWTSRDQKPAFGMLSKKDLKAGNAFVQADYVVGGIPLLIKDKKPIPYHQEKKIDSFRDDRHARTAVCVKQDGSWLWFVASHTKNPDREHLTHILEGFTLKELTDFLLKQGCIDAINLDGGGSSTLVINNKIVNQPAGDFNPLMGYVERPVHDAMLLKLK
jgi:exopolysaccharide biosynthesis protein